MIEPSRRHGFFDPRFSSKPFGGEHPSAAGPISTNQLPARLAWAAFSERLFLHRHRHDFEVQKAYEAYRNDACEAAQPPINSGSLSLLATV